MYCDAGSFALRDTHVVQVQVERHGCTADHIRNSSFELRCSVLRGRGCTTVRPRGVGVLHYRDLEARSLGVATSLVMVGKVRTLNNP